MIIFSCHKNLYLIQFLSDNIYLDELRDLKVKFVVDGVYISIAFIKQRKY